jgi:hypothetical protein
MKVIVKAGTWPGYSVSAPKTDVDCEGLPQLAHHPDRARWPDNTKRADALLHPTVEPQIGHSSHVVAVHVGDEEVLNPLDQSGIQLGKARGAAPSTVKHEKAASRFDEN